MGSYLSQPVTDKISVDELNDKLRYGASSMQGWRITQEVFGLTLIYKFSLVKTSHFKHLGLVISVGLPDIDIIKVEGQKN